LFIHFLQTQALQLSKVGLSTIKHQIIWHDGQKPLKPKAHEKMLIVSKSLFIKDDQNVHNLHRHMPGDVFSTGKLQCWECPVRNRTIPQLSIPSVCQQCSLCSGRHAAPSFPIGFKSELLGGHTVRWLEENWVSHAATAQWFDMHSKLVHCFAGKWTAWIADIFAEQKCYRVFLHHSNKFLQNTCIDKCIANPQTPKNPQTSPSHWGSGAHLTDCSLVWPHLLTQMVARLLHRFLHSYTTKSPLVTMGRPKMVPTCWRILTSTRKNHPWAHMTYHPKRHLNCL